MLENEARRRCGHRTSPAPGETASGPPLRSGSSRKGTQRAAVAVVYVASMALVAGGAEAIAPGCRPCGGLRTDDPKATVSALRVSPRLTDDSVLVVALSLGARSRPAPELSELVELGATPWLAVTFRTPAPLLDHLGELEAELAGLAEAAEAAGPNAFVQILWEGSSDPAEYAFLVKRASVAVAGVSPDALLITAPVPSTPSHLTALFALELSAYIDGIAVRPEDEPALSEISSVLAEHDPGSLVVIDGAAAPETPTEALAEAARLAAAGADLTLFRGSGRERELVPLLAVLAREFSGDLSLDPYSRPSGSPASWSFVRGSDLGVRIIARRAGDDADLRLHFSDPGLRDPALLDTTSGEWVPQWGISRSSEGLELELAAATPVVVVKLERMTAAELEGVLGLEEEVTVEDTRLMPVAEILRRLQAFEDAQNRRLENYRATNTTHLRFQVGTGAQSVEATFAGAYFVRRGGGYDWVWERFLINGIEWRGRTIPEIPLIQPEKAAALPVEITFGKEYRYALRGTAVVEGRDCWVVDFEPAGAVEPGRTLYQGTVWIDREVFARVRTRAVQLGLEGEVLSNEETVTFSPVDATGQPAPWSSQSFFLPLRLVGQQLWSVLNATTVVEREILLTDIAVNGVDFDERRQAAYRSEATMVRDTDAGLRYLVVDEATGERIVKEGYDTKRRFIVGGIFYDEAMDFPIPLAGFNWLWLDWRGTGSQANVFFAGALLTVGLSNPEFLGSRFDAGFDAFALALGGADTVFREGIERPAEEIETSNPNVDFKLGRPFGNFFKVDLRYQLGYRTFSRADGTAEEFVLPADHLNHTLTLTGRYNRRGYRFRLGGSYHLRGDWKPWGLPESGDFDPAHEDYLTWTAALAKTWHLPKFVKVGAELEYVDGRDLDRFSKFEFGIFSDVTVHGYQSNKVRGEEAVAVHLTYGFDVGDVFRLDVVGDLAWATDRAAGFDRETLAGLGIAGTVLGPWQTVMNLDVGVAVAGPDDGVTALVAFLKLFD